MALIENNPVRAAVTDGTGVIAPSGINGPVKLPPNRPATFNLPPAQGGVNADGGGRTTASVNPYETDPYDYSGDEHLIDYLERQRDAVRLKTPEEIEREERLHKANKKVSGIGDMVRAISNLFFTTKGAPNMYGPASSMSAKTQERYNRAKREREAEEDRWLNYSMTINQLKGRMAERKAGHAAAKAAWEMKQLAEERAKEKHEHNKLLWPTKEEIEAERLRRAKAAADKEEVRAKYEETLIQAKIDRLNRAGCKSSGLNGSGGKYWIDTPDGREYYPNATMYKAGVEYWSEKLNNPDVMELYTEGPNGTTRREVSKNTGQKAAGVKKASENKRKWKNSSKIKWD